MRCSQCLDIFNVSFLFMSQEATQEQSNQWEAQEMLLVAVALGDVSPSTTPAM